MLESKVKGLDKPVQPTQMIYTHNIYSSYFRSMTTGSELFEASAVFLVFYVEVWLNPNILVQVGFANVVKLKFLAVFYC